MGGTCWGGSGYLVEPGTLQHRFLEYTLISKIGFVVAEHHIKGSSLSRGQIRYFTSDSMHALALCSSVTSVYRCQLFFHPHLGSCRLSISVMNWYFRGRLDVMACLIKESLSSEVGFSDSEYHSMSKYKRTLRLFCRNI